MNRSMFAAALVALFAEAAHAAPIDAAETDLLLDRLIAGTAQYQDEKIGAALARGLEAGRARYRQVGDDAALAAALTDDMRRIGNDKHLRVRAGGPAPAVQEDPAVRAARQAAEEAAQGYGLTDIRRLSGNIGYLRLSYFSDERGAIDAIDAAMKLLAPTDALVIDLRQCSGGAPGTLRRLLGYFFATPVQMATIHWRRPGGRIETETGFSDRAPYPAYLDKPVYVLTAQRTFSAAEALAYDLRAEKRATLVGTTTRGGANPIDQPVRLTRDLVALIPNGRTEHPRTHANWEGVGVAPDVAAEEKDALRVALQLALEATRRTHGNDALGEERAWAAANLDMAASGQRWR